MNLNWDSLLEPIFLFILSLIAGTLWVIIPVKPKPPSGIQADDRQALAIAAQSRQAPAPSALVSKASELETETSELEKTVKALPEQSEMSALSLNQLKMANQQSTTRIESERNTLDRLNAQLRILETQVSGGPAKTSSSAHPNPDETADEIQRLRKTLTEREGEADSLQAQLETTQARPESQIPRVPTAMTANKLPILLELIHNRAVPVNKEFYRTKLTLLGPTVFERRGEGETIAELRAPHSAFQTMLEKIHPDRQYISCLLNSDSFQIFREVRRLVQEKHIDLGWEPADTSSGRITVYPVRITKNPEKNPKGNVPRVAPILR